MVVLVLGYALILDEFNYQMCRHKYYAEDCNNQSRELDLNFCLINIKSFGMTWSNIQNRVNQQIVCR